MELILLITDPCSGEKELACFLYYLKNTGFIWITANTFVTHYSTVSKLIVKVCETIAYNLDLKLVQFPEDDEQMKKKITEVQTKFRMPQYFSSLMGLISPYLNFENLPKTSITKVFILLLLCKQV